jgi:hypothetical protein
MAASLVGETAEQLADCLVVWSAGCWVARLAELLVAWTERTKVVMKATKTVVMMADYLELTPVVPMAVHLELQMAAMSVVDSADLLVLP